MVTMTHHLSRLWIVAVAMLAVTCTGGRAPARDTSATSRVLRPPTPPRVTTADSLAPPEPLMTDRDVLDSLPPGDFRIVADSGAEQPRLLVDSSRCCDLMIPRAYE